MPYNRHTYTSFSCSPSATSAIKQNMYIRIAIIAEPKSKAGHLDAGLTVRLYAYVYYMYLRILYNYVYRGIQIVKPHIVA